MSTLVPSPTASPWLHLRLMLLVVLLCLPLGTMLAQANSTSYTSDMPSVERVKTEIKGSDPTDTLARQVAVFTYLSAYIQRIKYNRSYSGPFTPDEQRLMGAYNLAAYQISQDYAKSHTADEAKAFERLHGQYEMNSDFYKDWSKRLIGKQSAAAYKGAETGLAATAKAHFDAEKRANEEARAAASKANGGLSNDPTAVATRRCLELGGSELQCLGKGLSTGVLDLFGISNSPLLQAPSFTGLTLTGQFKSGNGIDAEFNDTTVRLSHCGKLLIDSRAYTIQRKDSQILIHVKNSPSPFSFVLGSDGKLQGPASAEIAGKVITGYRRVWVASSGSPGYNQTQQQTSHQELTPLEAGQYAGQSGLTQNGQTYDMATTTTQSTWVPGSGGGGHEESVPVYAGRTQACSIGTLMPGAPTAVDPGTLTDIANVAGMVFGQPTNSARNAGQDLLAAGIRLAGNYTSPGGLKAEFADASVVLDCGQAHVRDKYTVERAGSRILVHVQNPASPFTVMVQPDQSLAGPASVTVAGRLVTGMTGNDVTYTPHSETCEVGTLTPKSASSSTSIAANTPVTPVAAEPVAHPSTAPVEAAANSRPPLAPASAPATAVRAAMRVAIAADFPSGSNPMVGQSVMVMRERMDEVLRKLGVAVPANATPGQAMQSLATTCKATNCRVVIDGMGHYFVTTVKLDAAGKATLSAQAATGPYFFFAIVRTPNGSMVWDIPANLRAGDNAITLTAANAELVP